MVNKISTSYLLSMLQNKNFDTSLRHFVKGTHLYTNHAYKVKKILLPFNEGIVGASVTLDIFWAIIYLTTLSFMMMLSLISIIGIAAIILGAGMAWKHHKKNTKHQQKLNQELENTLCEEIIYLELFNRKKQKLYKTTKQFLIDLIELAKQQSKLNLLETVLGRANINIYNLTEDHQSMFNFAHNKNLHRMLTRIFIDTAKPFDYSKTHFLLNKKQANLLIVGRKTKILKACVAGFTVMTILFGSFFSCSSYALVALGLSTAAAAVSNPITIGIALAIATIYGAYYAYKSYQHSHRQATLKNLIGYKKEIVSNLQTECDAIDIGVNNLLHLKNKIEQPKEAQSHFTSFFLTKRSPQTKLSQLPLELSLRSSTMRG